MKAVTKFLRGQMSLMKPFLDNCSLSVARKGQEKLGRFMSIGQRDDVSFEDTTVGGLPCSMVCPRDTVSAGVILYLHGGGYAAGGLDYAKGFASVLAAKCGIRVFCAAYRLAPEHIFPAALEDAVEGYRHLLSHGYDASQILLCGESAGGGLCYSLCLKLKEKGWQLPGGILAISPWTDLTLSGASYEKNEDADPYMTKARLKYYADCYVYGAKKQGKNCYPITESDPEADRKAKSDPLLSPLFGDLSRMPPSLIFAGGDEVMLDDAAELHKKLLSAGCRSELVVTPGMWHGYVLLNLKEHQGDFDQIRRFVHSHIPHQKKLRWMKLDNAAKIFPAARRRNWSNVFRLSATLREAVDKEVLKSALDVTVRRFPSIAVRLRRGFFWYYLEEIPHAPEILEEKPYPLARFPFDDIRKCAFRVIVYENRIAVEFFHALTDGNGGLIFLKTLVTEYLEQKYGCCVPCENGVLDRLEEPTQRELEDSFLRHEGPKPASRKDTDAYRIRGTRDPDGFKVNTTFLLDADQIKAEAKKRGITVTAYLTAALLRAAVRVQEKRVSNPKRYRPVKVNVPVNLRKLFDSQTLRNFVLYATPGIDPRMGEYDFEELCAIVHHQMKLQITPKNMAAMIATNVGDEKPLLLRMTPLFLKNIVMKTVFDAVGEKKSCFCFSNLGLAQVPEVFSQYVRRMDFVLGSQASAPYNTSAITYGGRLCLNVIRNIQEPLLEPEIYEVFRELGLRVQAESNARGRE